MSKLIRGSVACWIGIVMIATGCGQSAVQPDAQVAGPASSSAGAAATAPNATASGSEKVTTVAAAANSAPAQPAAAETQTTAEAPPAVPSPDQPAVASTPAKTEVTAEVTAEAFKPAEPTTAKAAIEQINLQKLPKLKPKQEREIGPTYDYYSSTASLDEANKYYEKLFADEGWKPAEHLVTSTDQYIDRMVTKDGYYVRLTLSTGGSGEVDVMLNNLGNFDMRSLPKTSDAELQDSTPVMAGYRTAQSITDASAALSKQMIDLGWQLITDTNPAEDELPHYRSMRFRKNAVRVNLGLVKDPVKPEEHVIVFYHAEYVLPMDIPTIDHRQPLRIDPAVKEVRIPWEGDRAALVTLLEKHGESSGWELLNKSAFVDMEAIALYIKTTPMETYGERTLGLVARYVESQGKYWIALERGVLPKPKSASGDTAPKVAVQGDEPMPPAVEKTPASTEIDDEIAKARTAADQLINQELAKALGSLGGSSKPDMQALQAQAAELQAKFGQLDADDGDAPASDSKPEAAISFDVPDDTEPVAAEDQKISKSVCRIKLGNKEFVLENSMALVKVEDGATVKIIMFSNKPLAKANVEKKFFAKESISMFEATSGTNPTATVEFQVMEGSIAMNLYADGLSLGTNSSHLKSTVRLHQGKLQGRVMLDEPMEVQDKQLTIAADISQGVSKPK